MATTEELMQDLACIGGSDHTATMMDSFILAANGVTTYGKYRQALRQLSTLIKGVRNLKRELSRVNINERECKYKLVQDFRDPFEKERCELDQDEAKWLAMDLQERIASKERELRHFYHAACTLREELNVDVSNPEVQLAVELDHWAELYCRDVTLQLQVTGTVHLGLLRDIHALPNKQRDQVLGHIVRLQLSANPRELLSNEERVLENGTRSSS